VKVTGVRTASIASIASGLALLLWSGSVAAQNTDADAERFFREGQKLMEERRFGEACPKFEAAYAKDRQLGTLINLAFCHKEQGALWYSWLEFREAEVKATELNRPDRRDFAKQRLTELEKQLPKVVLDNPQRMPLVAVLVEDRKVWEAERGTPFAVESGQRKFVFRARGKRQTTTLINVTATKNDRPQHVVVPDMEDDVIEPAVPSSTPEPKSEPKTEPPAADAHPGAAQRTIGFIGLGVGVVGVVVGSIFGVKTLSSPCAGVPTCPADQMHDANVAGTTSTIAFIVAGVGLIGGAALILTAPSPPSPRARITVTPRIGAGWAGLSGAF
jgi:hypothetical protein